MSGAPRLAENEGPILLGGFGTTVRVRSPRPGSAVSIVEHALDPRLLGAPPHRHEREDEISYVTEGTLTVQLADEITSAGPGDIAMSRDDSSTPSGTRRRYPCGSWR